MSQSISEGQVWSMKGEVARDRLHQLLRKIEALGTSGVLDLQETKRNDWGACWLILEQLSCEIGRYNEYLNHRTGRYIELAETFSELEDQQDKAKAKDAS